MSSANMTDVEGTIVAIGSACTPASRGAVRLSGLDAMAIAVRLGIEPLNRSTAHFVDTSIDLGDPLGCVPTRALLWPTTRSYTGQPALELHTFGSLPVLRAIVNRAIEQGARPARPGEFTLRAFLAGRLDLTQAEAVLGVIEAEGRGSLDHALRQLAGNLSRPMEFLRDQLLDLLADVEAGLDFVDEDIQFIDDEDLADRLTAIQSALYQTSEQLQLRSRDKSEWIVALRGLPNAGKSRLLNQLAGRPVAIVADVAGTTRDVVSVPIEISGHDFVFVDTAGIETVSGDSPLEWISRQAQVHSRRAGHDADIRLWCVDHASTDHRSTIDAMQKLATDKRRASMDLWIATKCDSGESRWSPSTMTASLHSPQPMNWIPTSALNGFGIETLKLAIVDAARSLGETEGTSIAGTAARCENSLRDATTAIDAAIRFIRNGEGHEYVSSELRLAANALGEVTGAVYTDDILDRVFSRFCIGK